MGFTDEEVRAWVLDGGTRFVPPQNIDPDYGEFDPDYDEVSAERQQLTDEDVRRALPMLGAAVDIDLAGAALLTDAIITEIGNRCPSLKTLDVRCASSPRAPPLPARARLSRARLAAHASVGDLVEKFRKTTLRCLQDSEGKTYADGDEILERSEFALSADAAATMRETPLYRTVVRFLERALLGQSAGGSSVAASRRRLAGPNK